MLTPPPSLLEKVPTLPPLVEQVVLKALEKDPQKRFGNVREFAQALVSVMGQASQPTYIPSVEFRRPVSNVPPTILANPRQYTPPVLQKTKKQWLDEGDIAYHAGRYEQAIAAYDHAITLDFKYAWAYARRGEVYRLLKEYQRAIQDYTEAITLNSEDKFAYAHRGEAYRMLNDYQKATQDLHHAIRLDPNYAWAYGVRGQVYASLKQYRLAIKDFDRTLQLDPNLDWVKNEREEAYRLLKNQR